MVSLVMMDPVSRLTIFVTEKMIVPMVKMNLNVVSTLFVNTCDSFSIPF